MRQLLQEDGRLYFAEIRELTNTSEESLSHIIRSLFENEKLNGYVNWSTGIVEAIQLPADEWPNNCPACGGVVEDAPRSQVHCAHCGADIYRPPKYDHLFLTDVALARRSPPPAPYITLERLSAFLALFMTTFSFQVYAPSIRRASIWKNQRSSGLTEVDALELIVVLALGIMTPFLIMKYLGDYNEPGAAVIFYISLPAAAIYLTIAAGFGSIIRSWSIKNRPDAAVRDWEKRRVLFYLSHVGVTTVDEVVDMTGVPKVRLVEYTDALKKEGDYIGDIDFESGIIAGEKALTARKMSCYNCGGRLDADGAGVIKCPYCGTEIFLNPK